MMKVNYEKLEMLRKSMHLSIDYLASLLNISSDEYTSSQDSYHSFDDEKISRITLVFNISREYLESDIRLEDAIFARSNGEIDEHDQIQIAELYEFQKMFG